VRVIVGTTVGFAVAVVLLNRPYMSAYDDPTGQLVLLAVGVLFAAGFAWLTRITRIPQPERFLATPASSPVSAHAGGLSQRTTTVIAGRTP
jgi:tight adherence protein B